MNAIEQIDMMARERIFQPLIDASQRMPRWWGGNAGWLFAVTYVMQYVLKDGPMVAGISDALRVLSGAAFIFVIHGRTQSDAEFAEVGGYRLTRLMMLALWAFGLGTKVLALMLTAYMPTAFAACVEINTLAMVAVFYFSACRPPAPPKARHQLQMGGA